jgi:phosphoenolpyruvate-protein phosphotransferase (PTS system enzyme I)
MNRRKLEAQEIILQGSPICRGIAVGKLFFLNRNEFKVSERDLPSDLIDREIERYRAALSRSKQDIKRLQKQLELESAMEGILILEAQLEMLQDPLLISQIEQQIRSSRKNAEFVFQEAIVKYQEKFQAIGDSFFAERFQDLQDIGRRVLGYLHESGPISLNHIPAHSIVFAQELTASNAAEATTFSVSAFITENGGATSHAAIVAKSKGIPYITNIPLEKVKRAAHSEVIVDGRTGSVILHPSPQTLQKYEIIRSQMFSQVQHLEQRVCWPAETFDGYAIRLSANLEMAGEIDLIHHVGAHGIGLFRSEYIFLPHNEIPSEEEQFKIYSSIVQKMNGLPTVIRTFDLGGDKTSSYYSFLSDKNSFLGCRATRFLLRQQDLFKTQLRAILRASLLGDVSILFPMISTISELREAKRMVAEVQQELNLTSRIRIGCMIEVPSAALIADHFARECDFLSIGTNDLIQYSMAVDRADQTIGEPYDTTDPSVIRLIKLITSEANRARIPVTVCGEMASDPRFIPLLLGLGVQELSVTPRYVPLIKHAIRNTSIVEAVNLAEKALHLKTAQEVLDLLSQEYQRIMPHDLLYNP